MIRDFTAKKHSRSCLLPSLGAFFLGILVVAVVVGPFLTSQAFDDMDLSQRLWGPSFQHWFGTDGLGRDLFARVLRGGRVSLFVGGAATLLGTVLGVFLGTLAGLRGGWLDRAIFILLDFFTVFPPLVWAAWAVVIFGPGLPAMVMALALAGWPTQARLVRARILELKTKGIYSSSQALGGDSLHVLTWHVWPTVRSYLGVLMAQQIPNNVAAESMLSFLGLGVQSPETSWGLLCAEGWRGIPSYPHLLLFPALTLGLTFFTLTVVLEGDSGRYRRPF